MRRTQKDEQGNWCVAGIPWEQLHTGAALTAKTAELLYGALWKLMEYEDTRLNPEEVERLNEFEGSQIEHLLKKLGEERKKHKWIPVTERLPENPDIFVLVQVCGKPCKNITLDNAQMLGQYDESDGWILEMYPAWEGANDGVIAWMPLQEPYRPE